MPYVKTNWMNNVTALNAANMNHIEQGIYDATNTAEAASSGKVDKVSTTGLAAYVHNGSTQTTKVISNTPADGQIPMYDSSNRIKCATPGVNGDCANKEYVDSATSSYTDAEIDELLGVG